MYKRCWELSESNGSPMLAHWKTDDVLVCSRFSIREGNNRNSVTVLHVSKQQAMTAVSFRLKAKINHRYFGYSNFVGTESFFMLTISRFWTQFSRSNTVYTLILSRIHKSTESPPEIRWNCKVLHLIGKTSANHFV